MSVFPKSVWSIKSSRMKLCNTTCVMTTYVKQHSIEGYPHPSIHTLEIVWGLDIMEEGKNEKGRPLYWLKMTVLSSEEHWSVWLARLLTQPVRKKMTGSKKKKKCYKWIRGLAKFRLGVAQPHSTDSGGPERGTVLWESAMLSCILPPPTCLLSLRGVSQDGCEYGPTQNHKFT